LPCIINHASVGFLRPCDVAERLYLEPALEPLYVEDLLSSLPTLSTGERRTAAFVRCSLRRIELVDFAIFAACCLPGPKI